MTYCVEEVFITSLSSENEVTDESQSKANKGCVLLDGRSPCYLEMAEATHIQRSPGSLPLL
jgi:hypothetical protein